MKKSIRSNLLDSKCLVIVLIVSSAINFFSAPRDPLNNVTFQKIPDEVTKFQVMFLPPSELNGNIQIYQAMVYKDDDTDIFQIYNLSVIDRTNNSITAMIEGLKGGHTYNISVS